MFIRSRGESAGANYRFRVHYETLRSVLNRNGNTLQLLADLEADLNHFSGNDYRILRPLRRLVDETTLMAQELNLMADNRYFDLYDAIFHIGAEIDSVVRKAPVMEELPMVVSLTEENSLNPAIVGGKAAGVAALKQLLPDSITGGFTITTAAYRLFLEKNKLVDRIRILLSDMQTVTDNDLFKVRTKAIRDLILSAAVPKEVHNAITRNATELADSAISGWAVRSSAISEDSRFTFAGQFDSKLQVMSDDLDDAYRFVVASRFSDRAVIYRLNCGVREVDTPMAVLFMPMIDPLAAGVIYTTDPQNPAAKNMVVNAVPGLGESVVKGTVEADIFHLSREPKPTLLHAEAAGSGGSTAYLPQALLSKVGALALAAASAVGHEMDMEWAVDKSEQIWLLQGRRIYVDTVPGTRDTKTKEALPLIEGGLTVFPGRAEGNVVWLGDGIDPASVPKGSVLIANQATPELAAALPKIAALLITEGNPAGHLAVLVREFAVPCIFRLGKKTERLLGKAIISVDATNRKIYEGSRWPGVRERVLNRIADTKCQSRSGPLYELVLAFNMTDPSASSFRAKNCQSIHDVIRFVHEMSVRSMFGFGDKQHGRWGKGKESRRVKTTLPLKLRLVDLDGSISSQKKDVEPAQIGSIPFQALWRGLSDTRLSWPERWENQFIYLPSEIREAVLGGNKGPRRRSDANYAMVASDYLNLNARFAYHYAMIDAIIGYGDEDNHVHFRFRGGGAGDENRIRRARLLESVLRQSYFGVDRREDLVTAWMQRYPQTESESALELIGRLMVCARQLDIRMHSDTDIKIHADRFLAGKYDIFQ
ncbi:MAG: pyruvate, water dikinase [Proteobacteria bacterium]|nr:pyruvate, water dikinase [Pseudomonadota bacterium]